MEIKFAMTDYENRMISLSVNLATREYGIESELDRDGEAHIIDEIENKVVPLILDSKLEVIDLKYLQFVEEEEIIPGFLYAANLHIAKVYILGAESVYVNNEIPMLIEEEAFPIAVTGGNLTGKVDVYKIVETDFELAFPYVIFESLRNKEMIQGVTHYPYKVKYKDTVSQLVSSVKLANNIIFTYDSSAMILALHEDEPELLEEDVDTHLHYLRGVIQAEDQFWVILRDVLLFYAKGDEHNVH